MRKMNFKGVDLCVIVEIIEGVSGVDFKVIVIEVGMFVIRDRRMYVM